MRIVKFYLLQRWPAPEGTRYLHETILGYVLTPESYTSPQASLTLVAFLASGACQSVSRFVNMRSNVDSLKAMQASSSI
jgi:hypothetical protein